MEEDTAGVAASRALADLASQFGDIARAMIDSQPGQQLVIEQVLQFASVAVPGSEYCAISLAKGNEKPETIVATADLPLQVDALQYATGQGPCLQALHQSDIAVADDLASDEQWPQFAARAVTETGIRSMLSFRLFLTSNDRATLNFYSRQPRAFTPMSQSTGAIFASYASLVLLNQLHSDTNMHLKRALESNREIGMAMGILMARELHTAEQAFGRLRVASQHLHRKLRDIADEVIHTGALPHHPMPGHDRRHQDEV